MDITPHPDFGPLLDVYQKVIGTNLVLLGFGHEK